MMHPIETWLKARRDYVEGKGFLPDIARKYGIPVQTVQTRAKREKWSTARAVLVARKTELPDAEPPPAPPSPQETPSDYVSQRLARVRLQLARLDDLLDSETDPQKIDRLASAIARLAEQERQLANRPLPGSRRPPKERPLSAPFLDVQPLGLAPDHEQQPTDPDSISPLVAEEAEREATMAQVPPNPAPLVPSPPLVANIAGKRVHWTAGVPAPAAGAANASP